ncbi:unnamed protein product [Closterium sp. NIES-53]
MFQHIKDLVELDDSGPKAWKLLRDVIQPNTLPMVIVLEKELAALSMRPGDDVKPILDKIKDTYARMAVAGSNVSQMQQCTKIISVLDNSWDNLIPTLNTQQDQWTPEWLRRQILQEDFRRRHTGGGAANKTAEGRMAWVSASTWILQEGARTLLERAGLPDLFWVTALRQVALVKNRVLATVGDKQWVPYTKWYGSAPVVNMLRAYDCMVVFHVRKEKRGKLEASERWGVHLGLAKDHKGWLIWDLTSQQLTVLRDVKFLESLYYKEWKQQQQKLPTTPLIIEADEVQRPSRQVQVTVSHEEIFGVTEDGGEPEVEEQQQQQQEQDAPPLSWRSKKQNKVGQSSCETGYMALHHGAKEVVWLRRLLKEIGVCQKEPTGIFCDNESAVKLAKNACLHGLTKHIRPKWHWVRRLLDKEVQLEIVKTYQQAVDILTKRLAEPEH